MHRNPEFTNALVNELAKAFNEAYNTSDKKPNGFVADLFRRYAQAFHNHAIFFGPIACIPNKERANVWFLTDLRGGWNWNPINHEFYSETTPTLETVLEELKSSAKTLRSKADDFEALANSFA